MQDLARRPATYADLEAVPPHLVAEIIHGELVTHPRSRPRHAVVSSDLTSLINGPFHLGRGGPGGWWILDEPELHLGADVLVPDLAGWRRERMPAIPETAYFGVAPDWACEVASPATVRYDRGPKRDIYARRGVKHLWVIDPDARLLESFELRDGLWVLLRTFTDKEEVAAAPFGAVPFGLGLLWAE